ncbi:MAG: hypothetical protein COC22_05520 [Flavobacteriaceae bacterium]|nr:MAG: hypothetical protein COC22_05520 [Flavobacteriaceae bacterium]
MKKIILILNTITSFVPCGSSKFVKTTNAPWSTIQLRDHLSYEKAWNYAINFLVTRFEMDII